MYTTTMTVDELINEFTADLPQILSISDAKQKKADKIINLSFASSFIPFSSLDIAF